MQARSGAQLVPATEAPGIASLDFTGFTSFLSVQSAGYQAWNSGTLAPVASYTFVPRASWGTGTWYLWVRARNLGSKPAPVYASVDGGAELKLGCVAGRDWTWVRTDLATGQPAAFTGLATDVAHTLRVAPGNSDVQLDLIKLAPEADHMECPVAATCGCAP